jgi:DNA polymerase (family 10)
VRQRFLTRTEVAERAPAGREICGDLQTYTVGSDGRHSVRAMAEAAAARGLAYLAITDHSKGLKIAGGMAALARHGDEIRGLNDELGPAILGSASCAASR